MAFIESSDQVYTLRSKTRRKFHFRELDNILSVGEKSRLREFIPGGTDIRLFTRRKGFDVYAFTRDHSVESVLTMLDAPSRLRFREKQPFDLTTIVMENRGRADVILHPGDILVGGMQNRLVSRERFARRGGAMTNLSTFCVEEKRMEGKLEFHLGKVGIPSLGALASLASLALEKKEQGIIWAFVRNLYESFEPFVPRTTEDFSYFFRIFDLSLSLENSFSDGTVGLLTVTRGERPFYFMDYFSDNIPTRNYFRGLWQAHALEALLRSHMEKPSFFCRIFDEKLGVGVLTDQDGMGLRDARGNFIVFNIEEGSLVPDKSSGRLPVPLVGGGRRFAFIKDDIDVIYLKKTPSRISLMARAA